VWDLGLNANLPADWRDEIVTSGRLPVVDYLEANPVRPGGSVPEEPGEEDPVVIDPSVPVAGACEWGIPTWNEAGRVAGTVEPGEAYWQLVEARLGENTMDHTLYVDAPADAIVKVRNANGTIETLPPKSGEARNRPIWPADCLEVWIEDAAGRKSDRVRSLHTQYYLQPGVNAGHVSYVLRFELRRAPSAESPELEGCSTILARLLAALFPAS